MSLQGHCPLSALKSEDSLRLIPGSHHSSSPIASLPPMQGCFTGSLHFQPSSLLSSQPISLQKPNDQDQTQGLPSFPPDTFRIWWHKSEVYSYSTHEKEKRVVFASLISLQSKHFASPTEAIAPSISHLGFLQ